MLTGQTLLYVVYALFAATAVLVVEAIYMQFASGRGRRAVNRRLGHLQGQASQEDALKSILRERGLTAQGNYSIGLVPLNRLFAQSGVTMAPMAFTLTFLGIGFVLLLVLTLFRMPLAVGLIAGLFVAIVLPILFLRWRRGRRQRHFERQLPDALDMMTRSLRAGHPTNVAINLVGREMPDPLGTEFGIVSDEIAFGSDLETAVRNMTERVGTESLRILSVAISIQSSTGGNLTEILTNISKVLRDRVVLGMKIRSLSAEGRLSAIMISLFPIFMFFVLQLVSPSFYGEIWGSPIVVPTFVIFGVWALIGDLIMYRMVNFDY